MLYAKTFQSFLKGFLRRFFRVIFFSFCCVKVYISHHCVSQDTTVIVVGVLGGKHVFSVFFLLGARKRGNSFLTQFENEGVRPFCRPYE